MSETEPHFYHHGRSPAAWTGTIMASVGFLLATVGAMIGPSWVLIIIGAIVVVLAMVAGLVLRSLGYGQG
jgi:hypothetical protein